MRGNDDGKTVAAMDMLVPRVHPHPPTKILDTPFHFLSLFTCQYILIVRLANLLVEAKEKNALNIWNNGWMS